MFKEISGCSKTPGTSAENTTPNNYDASFLSEPRDSKAPKRIHETKKINKELFGNLSEIVRNSKSLNLRPVKINGLDAVVYPRPTFGTSLEENESKSPLRITTYRMSDNDSLSLLDAPIKKPEEPRTDAEGKDKEHHLRETFEVDRKEKIRQ